MKRKFTSKPAFFNPRALIGFRLCLIGLLVGLLGAASAAAKGPGGRITVKYKKFPDGTELPGVPPVIVTGSTIQDASEYKYWVDGSNTTHKYEFLWWNANGTLEFNRKVGDNSTAGSNTFLTAWYIEKGGGGDCAPNCSVATWAFSITEDEVVTDTTPIASVSPPGLWTTPSTSVSTTTTSSSIVITARDTIPVPPKTVPPEKFQYWLGLPPAPGKTPPPTDVSFTVSAGSSGEEAACYQSPNARPPHITPCQSGNPHVNCYQ